MLAEFWADGPDSETPPGHWFVILNEVNDHPLLERRFEGSGPELSRRWNGTSRPISCWAARCTTRPSQRGASRDGTTTSGRFPRSGAMADRGQSSDANLASYDIDGIPLSDGYIELVDADDALVGVDGEHVGKIKLLAWRGPDFIEDPRVDAAGVGWILAEALVAVSAAQLRHAAIRRLRLRAFDLLPERRRSC